MGNELKPCPFCGSSAHKSSANQKWVFCDGCRCSMDSIDEWNTRHEPKGLDEHDAMIALQTEYNAQTGDLLHKDVALAMAQTISKTFKPVDEFGVQKWLDEKDKAEKESESIKMEFKAFKPVVDVEEIRELLFKIGTFAKFRDNGEYEKADSLAIAIADQLNKGE